MHIRSSWPLLPIVATALALTQGESPRFEDYPARDTLRAAPVSPKLTNPDDRRFRTALTLGVAKGPNFAGAFTVVLWGCGTSCQSGALVDGRTGQVWNLPHALTRGAKFERSSRLFIADPVPPQPQPYESPFVFYYEWQDTSFVLIDSLRAPVGDAR